jgi:CheY-like chemotaxis protein
VILSANVGKKPVELLFDIDPELPLALVADAMRLQQVLINLGGNAIKFTDTGEVVVSLRLMAYQGDCALVRFAVRDTGIGVAQENVKHIFEQFSQAERSTTRRFGGTGLGLAICQHFVHLMGGTIQVESRVGVGSEFFFEIPLPIADPSQVDDSLLLPNLSDSKPLRVLLVDDNLTALQLLADISRSLGWVVDVASSGHQAVALLNRSVTQQKAYDLAIVDDQMPGMSGWETVRSIRQRELQPPCHLLLVTANSHQDWLERSETEKAWVNGVLTKPVTASMLFDAVVRYPEKGLDQHLKATRTSKPKRLIGMRLLVVEDNAINQQVASELLKAEGASVALAADGYQGIQAVLSASEAPFDAVLMDMEMPVMDGITATHELRQVHKRQDLIIIAMTANAMDTDKQACLVAGMNAHVSKPLDMEQLVRTLLQYAPKDLARRLVNPAQTTESESNPKIVEAAQTPQFSSSNVLDVSKAIERLGGESEVYFELVEPFIEDSTHLMHELKLAASQQQGQELVRHLHTLKGIAATMGADELADLARQLESDVKSQLSLRASPELQSEKIANLEASLSAVHEALHQALAQQAKTTLLTSSSTSNLESHSGEHASLLTKTELDEQLRQGLQHLADLLRKADLTALSLYRELQQHHAAILQTHGRLLAELISTFDFEHAATQCDALLNKLPLTSKA